MGIFKLDRLKKKEKKTFKHSILLVDDDPENLTAFTSFLNKEYHVVTALDGSEALDIIAKGANDRFQLIISDQRMPKLTGVEFLEKTLALMPNAKRIILSGFTDADAIIASINQARIHEFLLKPVERNRLRLTVQRALEAHELEERTKRLNAELEAKVVERTRELEAAMAKLEAMATTDQLTGAFNRRKFEEIIDREVQSVRRYGQPLSLVIFDIDHFKKVNDKYGHLAGDDVLKQMVNIVAINIRPMDCLIRWGGEEFLVVIPQTDLAGSVALSEKIRVKIEEHNFPFAGKLTISAGITQYQPDEKPDQCVFRADRALYEAKRHGRNQVMTG